MKDERGIEIPEYVLNWQANLRAKEQRAAAASRAIAKDEQNRDRLASDLGVEIQLRANGQATPVSLPLSTREALVAKLYADDHSAEDIGLVLGLSTETIKSYLRRVRLKYRNDGRTTSNRLQLRACLIEDGLLTE